MTMMRCAATRAPGVGDRACGVRSRRHPRRKSEKAFYAGKTVRMIVGSGTGGGYDVFSRMIAPYLAKTLGTHRHRGEPARRRRARRAQPAVHGDAGRPADFAVQRHQRRVRAAHRRPGRALRPRQVQLSRDRGRAARPVAGGPGFADPEVQQAVDAKMKWRWASSGATSGLGIGAAFTCEALKLDCHVVQGYKGSADAGLAVTRGEMDALYVPESSANNFVKRRAELGAGDDVARQVALLPGPADHLRGGQDGCRPDLGDGLPRQCREARPHPGGAARHSAGAARLSAGGDQGSRCTIRS